MSLGDWEGPSQQRKRPSINQNDHLLEPLIPQGAAGTRHRQSGQVVSEPHSHADFSSPGASDKPRGDGKGVRHARSSNKLPSLLTRKSDQSRRSEANSVRSHNDDSSSSSKYRQVRRKAVPHRVPVLNPDDLVQDDDETPIDHQFDDPPLHTVIGPTAPTVPRKPSRHGDPRRLPRGLSFAAVDRGHVSFNPAFTIRHKWLAFSHKFDFWFRDRFHVLLGLSFKSLVCVLVLAEFLWAAFLAVILGIVTRGDVEHCLGGFVTHWIHYYYFTVETMFTVGFGEPRYPSCTAANLFVSFAVMLTNVLHGTLIGLVFSKFSSGTGRRWAIAFSPELCGAVVGNPLVECDRPPHESLAPQATDDGLDLKPFVVSNLTEEEEDSSILRNHGITATAPAYRRSRLSQSRRSEVDTPERRSAGTTSERLVGGDELSDISDAGRSLDAGRVRIRERRNVRGMSFHMGVPPHPLIRNYQHLYTSTGIKRSTLASRYDKYINSDPDARFPLPQGNNNTTSRSGLMASTLSYCLPRPGSDLCRSLPAASADIFAPAPQQNPPPTNHDPPAPHPRTPTPERLDDFEKPSIGFSLSFRLMNLTDSSFFDPKLSIFLLLHDQFDLTITQILRYHTDVPLEFLELPVTVTVDSRDTESPLSSVSLPDLVRNGHLYEFMVLLTFVDNQSSRTIELRKSWRLNCITWGKSFKGIVKRERPGAYEIDVEALDSRMVLVDPLNKAFVGAVRNDLQQASNVNIGIGGPPGVF